MDRRPGTGWRHDALNALSAIDSGTYMLEHHSDGLSEQDRAEILEALRNGIDRLREILDPPGGAPPDRTDPDQGDRS